MTEKETKQEILSNYKIQREIYADLAITAASLIANILRNSNIQIHSITHRCKELDSLSGKLSKDGKNYSSLEAITDLAGIRITSYFANDVDTIAKIIESEFNIDWKQSTDKRQSSDPDRFGYQSLHYIIKLRDDRCKLIEYKRFQNKNIEIQIRSILQHAWAEIEHDLGYKSSAGLPRLIRRRFARIAGLLELADDEFSGIRNELLNYAAKVPDEISAKPETVEIDQISLKSLLSNNKSKVKKLSIEIAKISNSKLTINSDKEIDKDLILTKELGVNTIAQLESVADKSTPIVLKFVKLWIDGPIETFKESISLFYLVYIHLAEKGDKSAIIDYFSRYGILLKEDRDTAAQKVLDTYKSITGL